MTALRIGDETSAKGDLLRIKNQVPVENGNTAPCAKRQVQRDSEILNYLCPDQFIEYGDEKSDAVKDNFRLKCFAQRFL